ncbi:hypothetical protein SRHO_G00258000 [Serrasalmus rhombeus]
MEIFRAVGVPPEVSLYQKDSSSPVVCHATGFFPKAVLISWQKNGDDLHEDVELRETVPNQDGTFQKRSVLTVSPEELNRNQYSCVVQHSSLQEEMVLQLSVRSLHDTQRRNLIMKSLLFLALTINLASAASHSLQYLYTGVTPGINFPEFTVVGLVDGGQFVYYDSDIRKLIPKTEWIKKSEADDPGYWNRETQISQGHQENFKANVGTLKQRFNQTDGVHTVQWMYGCEVHGDGTRRGYMQYGYDGEDFISLDLNTETWTAANPKAVITKQMWEHVNWAAQVKNYLDNSCTEWLHKYVEYGRSTLERKVSPEVSLFQKDSSSPVVCFATGFFPKAVMISWQKNGEDLHEDVEIRETLLNQDGTFQKRSVLTVSPEELNRNVFTCIIQHSSLEKEMMLQVSDLRDLSGGGSHGGLFGVIISAVLAVLLFSLWKMMKECEPSDESLLTKVIFSPVDYESTEMK